MLRALTISRTQRSSIGRQIRRASTNIPSATTTTGSAAQRKVLGKSRVPSVPSHISPPPTHSVQPLPYVGPPRLIRNPPEVPRFSYTRSPVSRLFAYYNAASATSSIRTRGEIVSPTSSTLVRKARVELDRSDKMSTSLETSETSSVRKRNTSSTNGKENHSHAHSSWLPHSHSHAHGQEAEGSAEEADRLIAALKGKGDRGSNITVVGLIANLILCGGKGIAGVWLHSASLLADAAHSLSDTFSDVVTLFCWKMSQKPASLTHPMGYGKFETMGGLGVSVVLVAGAFAIGMHSYSLLLEVLQPALQDAPYGLKVLSSMTGDLAKLASSMLHDHHGGHSSGAAGGAMSAADTVKDNVHGHGHDSANLLDPNAMWFALISILVKEWLYRATLKIAKEENSSVLEANAIHHRSDSLSSGVTFLAIGGSYLGFPVLDPLGGLLVAGLIGKQGAELLIGALQDLSDRGVQPEVLEGFENALKEVMEELEVDEENHDHTRLKGWTDLRAIRSGVSSFVDVTLVMSEETKLKNARIVESKVREKIIAAHKGVKEVRIQLDTEGHFHS